MKILYQYQEKIVKPFYEDYFSQFDRQVILADCLTPLNHSQQAFIEMKIGLQQLFKHFHYGNRSLFHRLFSSQIDKFNFSLSRNFAKRLFSENSADIPFQSNGSFKFKYATLPQSLNGVLHIGTNTLKGLGFLLKEQGNGYYGTDLVIKNGQYQLGDFSLSSDFLKNSAINGLIEKIKLEDKLNLKGEKIEK